MAGRGEHTRPETLGKPLAQPDSDSLEALIGQLTVVLGRLDLAAQKLEREVTDIHAVAEAFVQVVRPMLERIARPRARPQSLKLLEEGSVEHRKC